MSDATFFIAISVGGGLIIWQATNRSLCLRALYRFLAFELLLILALLTRHRWLVDPLSTSQVISWVLWVAGLAFALSAIFQRPARPSPRNPAGGETGAACPFPPPQGIYKIVRHPIYAAALLAGWGLFAKGLTPSDNMAVLYAFLLTSASLFLIAATRADEMADYLKYGTAYAVYVKSSRMLIPFLL